MNLTIEQLAEIIAGIAKSQQAIIDAVDSENAGWKNTHLLPKINSAANLRFATPRLIDVPARVLMRSQGRNVMDVAAAPACCMKPSVANPFPPWPRPHPPPAATTSVISSISEPVHAGTVRLRLRLHFISAPPNREISNVSRRRVSSSMGATDRATSLAHTPSPPSLHTLSQTAFASRGA